MAAAQAQTSGTLTATTTTYNYSTAPWVITSGTGTYPDGGGVATFNPNIGATPGTVAGTTTVTIDVSPTLSQITYNSPFNYNLAAGTGTSIVAATTGLTLAATLTPANTPTLFQLADLISSPISGGGTAGVTKTGSGTVSLSGVNTYTGGTHINGGVLVASSTAAVGDSVFGDASGGISFNGGALFTNVTGGLTDSRNIFIDTGGATIYTNTAATLNGVISGTGSLTNQGFAAVALTLTGINTYTGATVDAENVSSTVLSGNGTINQSSSYDFTGTLTLSNAGTNVLDRLSDTAPMTIRGLNFISTGNATATSSETIGAVTAASSFSSFLVTPGSTAANSLTMASLTRQNNATLDFRGTGVGGTPGNTVSNIYVTSAPTLTGGGGAAGSTTISIIPYAIGNSTAATAFTAAGQIGSSFVTYDVNGIRPLATAEYATAFGGNNTDNVRITAATAVPGTGVTANAVLLAPATAAASALSGGPINITSGAFLYSPTANVTGTVSAALNFGTAEGVITNTSLLALSSPLSGSGGVTYTTAYAPTAPSTATITVTGASSYTGNTTLNSGTLAYSGTVAAAGNNSVFGSSGTIVLAAGVNFAALEATAATTLNRDISSIGSGINYLSVSGSGFTSTFNGNISLGSSLYIYGFSNSAASAFTFNGTISGAASIIDTGSGYSIFNGSNTYTGGSTIGTGGTFVAGSNTAFGTGPIYTTGATGTISGVGTTAYTLANNLFLSATTGTGGAAPLTFTGSVNLNGARCLTVGDTGGTTFTGVVSNGSLTKTGTSVLSLNSSTGNTYTGGTVLGANVGALIVNNTSGSGTGTGGVSIGGTSQTTFSALAGSFTLSGTTNVAGRVSPGNSGLTAATAGIGAIGTANFGGNLTFTSATSSSAYLEIGASNSNDQINVGGVLTLVGTTYIATTNGYTIQPGDTFVVATFTSETGTPTFNTTGATLAPGVTLTETFTSSQLIITAVPEPGTWAAVLGGLGVLGSVQFARRRRNRRA